MATCNYCGGEMLFVTGCTESTLTINGDEVDRIPADPHGRQCHDCGVLEGEYHHFGCDMETCPSCDGQLLGHILRQDTTPGTVRCDG